MIEAGDLWCVVPCMGRLAHLKRSLPLLLDAGLRVVLVDYCCPDHCGDWASRQEAEAVAAGNLTIVRVTGRRAFHKAAAHNLGASCAIARGARFLCFLDADTLVTHGFADWCRAHAAPGRFGVVYPTRDGGDLTGVLLVASDDLLRWGKFDESFVGYGKEDIEIRLRYRLVGGLEYDLIPRDLLDYVPHSDELRTRHYAQTDRRRSDRQNFRRLCQLVQQWTGQKLGELHGPDVTPLLGVPLTRGPGGKPCRSTPSRPRRDQLPRALARPPSSR